MSCGLSGLLLALAFNSFFPFGAFFVQLFGFHPFSSFLLSFLFCPQQYRGSFHTQLSFPTTLFMPPRKRTAKQAQTTADDPPKPQKRQKKSDQGDHPIRKGVRTETAGPTESTAPLPSSEPNDHLTPDQSPAENVQPPVSNGQPPHDQQQPPVHRMIKPAAGDAEGDEEEEDAAHRPTAIHVEQPQRASDLYLDTVNRAVLDFDFEKVCSVSLSNINIYGCLVCGKYFQGRSRLTPAFAHSIHDDHHVFMNLESSQVSHSYSLSCHDFSRS